MSHRTHETPVPAGVFVYLGFTVWHHVSVPTNHCSCDPPQAFDGSDTCNRCGRSVPCAISASTMRLAVAIAEVALGYRRIGEDGGAQRKNKSAIKSRHPPESALPSPTTSEQP